MGRLNGQMLAFNRGEVSKIAHARVDVEKLRLSAECQVNWMPFVLGPMMLRPGMQFIGLAKDQTPSHRTKQLPFFFATADTARLDLSDSILRIWISDVLVSRASVSTAVTSGTFGSGTGWNLTSGTTDGGSATIAGGQLLLTCVPVGGLAQARQTITVAGGDIGVEHGLRVVVSRGPVTVRAGSAQGLDDFVPQTVLDTGTHSLALTPSGNVFLQIETATGPVKTLSSVTIDAAGTLELPTPWAQADLANLRIDQSGDIVFVWCHGKPQYKIERRSLHGWSVAQFLPEDGPFGTTPPVAARLTLGGYVGTVTLNSDVKYFQVGHIGALFRLFCKGQFYFTELGAENAFTPAARVAGVGALRNLQWTRGGTWVGTLTVQISFDGPDAGFVDLDTKTVSGTNDLYTSGTTTPSLDNQIVWYRAGFKAGDYTSGVATVEFSYGGGGAAAIVRVASFVDAENVNVDLLTPVPSTAATSDWLEGEWSAVQGYPDSGCFFEGRLFQFGRDRTWGSGSNQFASYATADLNGQPLGDAGAIIEAFGAGPVDAVHWGLSLSRLLAGREGSVASIRSSSFDEVLTPTNFSQKDCSTQGVANLPALKLDKTGIFVQRSGRRVYLLAFNASALDYSAHDLTRLNLDIGKPGFRALDIARQPDTQVLFARNDGQLAVLLHEAEDEVECWWRMQTLGLIEDVVVLPSATGVEDLIYLTVLRTINGTPVRTFEKLAPRDNCTGGLLNQMLDCHIVQTGPTGTVHAPHLPNTLISVWADGSFRGTGTTDGSGALTLPGGGSANLIVAGVAGSVQTYSGTPTATFTGLSAFEGLPCEVFADQQPSGRVVRVGTLTVSGGTLTLPPNWLASSIVACFGYVAPFMSAKLAYAAQHGSALTQRKKLGHVGLVLFDTHAQGVRSGQRMDQLEPMPLTEDGGDVDQATVWSQYDEPMISMPGEWDTDARLCLLAQAPFPCKVGGVVVDEQTND